MTHSDDVRTAELAEVGYLRAMWDAASPSTRLSLQMTRLDQGEASTFVMAKDPTGGFWNRTIGLGVAEPVTEEHVRQAIGFATAGGFPQQVFQLAPDASPADWPDLLASAGATPSADWAKFVGRPPLTYDAETDLRVERLGPGQEQDYARVMCEGFGMPTDSGLPEWFAEVCHADGWTAYGAFDGDRPVAVASLWVQDGLAALCGAATLPEARGRGAQGSLMGIRLADAWAAGATSIGSETGAEASNPSLHNMRRVGLTEVYTRTNWIWRG